MSLKPPKKSDLDKSWIKPRRDSIYLAVTIVVYAILAAVL